MTDIGRLVWAFIRCAEADPECAICFPNQQPGALLDLEHANRDRRGVPTAETSTPPDAERRSGTAAR